MPFSDTYVKAYLFDGERRIEKRKTAVVDQSCEPVFRQAAKFLASDARDAVLFLSSKRIVSND